MGRVIVTVIINSIIGSEGNSDSDKESIIVGEGDSDSAVLKIIQDPEYRRNMSTVDLELAVRYYSL